MYNKKDIIYNYERLLQKSLRKKKRRDINEGLKGLK